MCSLLHKLILSSRFEVVFHSFWQVYFRDTGLYLILEQLTSQTKISAAAEAAVDFQCPDWDVA